MVRGSRAAVVGPGEALCTRGQTAQRDGRREGQMRSQRERGGKAANPEKRLGEGDLEQRLGAGWEEGVKPPGGGMGRGRPRGLAGGTQTLEPGAQSKVLKACDFFHRGCWREGGQRRTRTAWKSRPHGRERYLLPLGPKSTAGAPAPGELLVGRRGVRSRGTRHLCRSRD